MKCRSLQIPIQLAFDYTKLSRRGVCYCAIPDGQLARNKSLSAPAFFPNPLLGANLQFKGARSRVNFSEALTLLHYLGLGNTAVGRWLEQEISFLPLVFASQEKLHPAPHCFSVAPWPLPLPAGKTARVRRPPGWMGGWVDRWMDGGNETHCSTFNTDHLTCGPKLINQIDSH